jgi:hypothetical protein
VPLVELFQVDKNPRIGHLKRTLSFGSQYRMLFKHARAEYEAAVVESKQSARASPKRRGAITGSAALFGHRLGESTLTASMKPGAESAASLFGGLPRTTDGNAAECNNDCGFSN